jgi:hypothetical protein
VSGGTSDQPNEKRDAGGDMLEGTAEAWRSSLAGRPPLSLVLLIERNAYCHDQKNSRSSGAAQTRERNRADLNSTLILLVATVVGIGVYFLAVRMVGAAVATRRIRADLGDRAPPVRFVGAFVRLPATAWWRDR